MKVEKRRSGVNRETICNFSLEQSKNYAIEDDFGSLGRMVSERCAQERGIAF
jgi:hypothetical protein